jgi:citrate synthase
MSDKTFTLKDNDTNSTAELQSHTGTLGPEVVDVRKLYAQTGKFTFDPGFTSTASCESAITFIDG